MHPPPSTDVQGISPGLYLTQELVDNPLQAYLACDKAYRALGTAMSQAPNILLLDCFPGGNVQHPKACKLYEDNASGMTMMKMEAGFFVLGADVEEGGPEMQVGAVGHGLMCRISDGITVIRHAALSCRRSAPAAGST